MSMDGASLLLDRFTVQELRLLDVGSFRSKKDVYPKLVEMIQDNDSTLLDLYRAFELGGRKHYYLWQCQKGEDEPTSNLAPSACDQRDQLLLSEEAGEPRERVLYHKSASGAVYQFRSFHEVLVPIGQRDEGDEVISRKRRELRHHISFVHLYNGCPKQTGGKALASEGEDATTVIVGVDTQKYLLQREKDNLAFAEKMYARVLGNRPYEVAITDQKVRELLNRGNVLVPSLSASTDQNYAARLGVRAGRIKEIIGDINAGKYPLEDVQRNNVSADVHNAPLFPHLDDIDHSKDHDVSYTNVGFYWFTDCSGKVVALNCDLDLIHGRLITNSLSIREEEVYDVLNFLKE